MTNDIRLDGPPRISDNSHSASPLRYALITALLAGLPMVAQASPPPLPTPPGATCQAVTVPVTLVGADAPLNIAGTFCSPTPVMALTVQILVPGYTYGQAYWNFPFQPETYSYVRAATGAGFATLSIDRLGTGLSSHPPVLLLTFDNQVEALHQVVQAVRNGTVSGAAVSKVIVVGHSLGSGLAAANQVAHPTDADGLILTGYSHTIGVVGVVTFLLNALYPAKDDPRFAGVDLPAAYFTTIPGKRPELFYGSGAADPVVKQKDEELKETTGNAVEVLGLGLLAGTVLTPLSINVPVLVAAGDKDTIACGTPLCLLLEPPFYQQASKVSTISMPNTGHDLNLSYSAPSFFNQATAWATQKIGTTSD